MCEIYQVYMFLNSSLSQYSDEVQIGMLADKLLNLTI